MSRPVPSVIGETGPAPYRHGVSLVGIESSTDRLSPGYAEECTEGAERNGG